MKDVTCKNIEIRKCDYMLCDSCNDEFTENQQEDDSLYQVDGAILDDGPKGGFPVMAETTRKLAASTR